MYICIRIYIHLYKYENKNIYEYENVINFYVCMNTSRTLPIINKLTVNAHHVIINMYLSEDQQVYFFNI